jgi:hypothetical protein
LISQAFSPNRSKIGGFEINRLRSVSQLIEPSLAAREVGREYPERGEQHAGTGLPAKQLVGRGSQSRG